MPQNTVPRRLDRQADLFARKQRRTTVQINDDVPGRTPGRQRPGREEVHGGGNGPRGGFVAPLPASGGARAGPRLEEAVAPDRAIVDQRNDVRVPEGRQCSTATEPGVGLDAARGRDAPQPDGLARRQIYGLTRGPDDEPVGEDIRWHDCCLFCKIVADGAS
jgi:hypothetical protein